MSEKLKPCPKCLSQNVSIYNRRPGKRSWWSPECKCCGIEGVGSQTKKDAIREWNRRTTAPMTSVVTWVRYDGTEETLPEREKLILVKFPDVDIAQMAYLGEEGIYTWTVFSKSNVMFQQECRFQRGFVWAYLPTPPEADA